MEFPTESNGEVKIDNLGVAVVTPDNKSCCGIADEVSSSSTSDGSGKCERHGDNSSSLVALDDFDVPEDWGTYECLKAEFARREWLSSHGGHL